MKFVRRAVETYTTEWQKNENRASSDRTPGLGTSEVLDTSLRNFSLRTFAVQDQPNKMVRQLKVRAQPSTTGVLRASCCDITTIDAGVGGHGAALHAAENVTVSASRA